MNTYEHSLGPLTIKIEPYATGWRYRMSHEESEDEYISATFLKARLLYVDLFSQLNKMHDVEFSFKESKIPGSLEEKIKSDSAS